VASDLASSVASRELDDYTDIMEAHDLQYAPMISEYEVSFTSSLFWS
jgi:hypothetical protein